jgi:hypothetical protein
MLIILTGVIGKKNPHFSGIHPIYSAFVDWLFARFQSPKKVGEHP